jgi:hypothetical protein
MKLRIKGDSIRLRLGRSEVRRMLNHGIVEESTTFDLSRRQRLEYALCDAPDAHAVTAAFDDGRITVRVPGDLLRDWAATDQAGIEAYQVDADGGVLRILIEKDLECIDAAAGESQEDAFPHPQFDEECTLPTTAGNNNVP